MIRLANMKQWAVGAFACGLIAAGPAAAQLAQNSDAPVDITADELEVINARCLATYSGGAEALQDTVRLRADVLKIYYKPNPSAKPGGTGQAGVTVVVQSPALQGEQAEISFEMMLAAV